VRACLAGRVPSRDGQTRKEEDAHDCRGRGVAAVPDRCPGKQLADLRDRLDRVRWAPEPRGGDQGYGVSRAFVQRLAAHWRDGYDGRVWESRINEYPGFTTTTTTDGTNVHLHVRSPEPNPLPLVLSHGWPGSVAE
jgi:epoxide hydrolase